MLATVSSAITTSACLPAVVLEDSQHAIKEPKRLRLHGLRVEQGVVGGHPVQGDVEHIAPLPDSWLARHGYLARWQDPGSWTYPGFRRRLRGLREDDPLRELDTAYPDGGVRVIPHLEDPRFDRRHALPGDRIV